MNHRQKSENREESMKNEGCGNVSSEAETFPNKSIVFI